MRRGFAALFVISALLLLTGVLYSMTNTSETCILTHPHPVRVQIVDSEPRILAKSHFHNQTRKPTINVIVYLVASFSGDAARAFDPYPRLLQKIPLLDQRLGDNCTADLIIFHTGYPFRSNIDQIFQATRRHVAFVNVDDVFYRFSPGFDPHLRDPSWSQRGKWNYHQMCYSWFKTVFELKIMRQYRYMMRLDDDSQLLGTWPDVFQIIIQHRALYMANHRTVDYDWVLPGVTRVRNVTSAFIAEHRIQIQNPEMIADLFNHTLQIPNFWNNFEVLDLSLMQRQEVVQFIDAIDRSQGIFLYRWGDAPLRYITLALFVRPSDILHRVTLKLDYCHPC